MIVYALKVPQPQERYNCATCGMELSTEHYTQPNENHTKHLIAVWPKDFAESAGLDKYVSMEYDPETMIIQPTAVFDE